MDSRRGGRHLSGSGSKRLSNELDGGGQKSTAPGAVYESLEEIHIFALAHVLRRPIIVVADLTLKDVHGAPLSPIPFGGVYLPLQYSPSQCHKSPLLLTYDAAHFSALVVMEKTASTVPPAVIPLTTNQHKLLPLHFAVDPGMEWRPEWHSSDKQSDAPRLAEYSLTQNQKLQLLRQYLEVVQVPISHDYKDYHEFEYEPAERDFSPSPFGDKKSSESSGESDDPACTCDSTSQGGHLAAPKNCAKHSSKLGTLSRSMSKKFKSLKKIRRPASFRKKDHDGEGRRRKGGSLGRRSSFKRPHNSQNFILGAAIITEKRMAFQEKMVQNYLTSARQRFQDMQELRREESEAQRNNEKDQRREVKGKGRGVEASVACINTGCNMYGTASTAYLCSSCYSRQKDGELAALDRRKHSDDRTSRTDETDRPVNESPHGSPEQRLPTSKPPTRPLSSDVPQYQYGAGRAQFYAHPGTDNISKSATLPPSPSPSSPHSSALFLANSTFYSRRGSAESGSDVTGNKEVLAKLPKPPRTTTTTSAALPPAASRARSKREGSVDRRGSNSSSSDHSSSSNNNNINSRPVQITDRPVINVDRPGQITDRAVRVKDTGAAKPVKSAAGPQPCRRQGCTFFGNQIFDGFCSKCAAQNQ